MTGGERETEKPELSVGQLWLFLATITLFGEIAILIFVR
jgi:hypothetical protein